MKISDKMAQAINSQIGKEFASERLYLSMSAHFESLNLPGFASWMRKQADEERTHALKLFDYLSRRGGRAELGVLAAPPSKWASPLAVFEQALAHEQAVTASIGSLVDTASALKDHATVEFLDWFVAEQVEEEEQATLIVERLRAIGGAKAEGAGLLFLDNQMGQRKD